jgi:hypothetical protein
MLLRKHSRASPFRRFNSRLGGKNSRLGALRGFSGKASIYNMISVTKRCFSGQNRKNSRLRREQPGIVT